MRRLALLSGLFLLGSCVLWGQENVETQARLKALEERIGALEAEIKELKAHRAEPPPAAETATTTATQAPEAAPAPTPQPGAQAGTATTSTTPIGR